MDGICVFCDEIQHGDTHFYHLIQQTQLCPLAEHPDVYSHAGHQVWDLHKSFEGLSGPRDLFLPRAIDPDGA